MRTVAIYLRLSQEDNGAQDESNSISNQRILLLEFLRGKSDFSGCEILEYCDDGFSGTSFVRPGVTRLLEDMRHNLIGCIVVKDFSRFSRDYIEMGSYLDQIFPFMGVRFIAVNDHYDSNAYKGMTVEIDTVFKTLLNDFYSKDLSVKVKTAIKSKCDDGEYVFGQLPLGYEKDPERKHHVRINETEAEIVRYIFELSAGGLSPMAIEKRLHDEGLPTCQQMRGRVAKDQKRICCWSSDSIRKILKNRFYLGEFVYGKAEVDVVGSKKTRTRSKSEWITLPGHHEPLITEELFIKAAYGKSGNSTKRKKPKHPLTGKLYCGGCGYAMIYKEQAKGEGKINRRFECRKHAQLKIASCCTYYNAEVLEELVLAMVVKELVKLADLQESRDALKKALRQRIGVLEDKIGVVKWKREELEKETYALYEAYSEGKVDAVMYKEKWGEIHELINKQNILLVRYQKDLLVTERACLDQCEDLKQVLMNSQINELTSEVVDSFLRKIKVYKDKSVEIDWLYSLDKSFLQTI